MDDLLQPQQSPQAQKTHKELQRRANDLIRVANPTDQDYNARWDGLLFLIPAKTKDIGYGPGQAVHPRYIAQNYVKHMTEKILGDNLMKQIKETDAQRIERGQGKMKPYEEREAFDSQLTVNWPQETREIFPKLWLGIEKEYGMEAVQEDQRRVDSVSTFDDLFAQADRPATPLPANPEVSKQEPVSPPPVQTPLAEGNELA